MSCINYRKKYGIEEIIDSLPDVSNREWHADTLNALNMPSREVDYSVYPEAVDQVTFGKGDLRTKVRLGNLLMLSVGGKELAGLQYELNGTVYPKVWIRNIQSVSKASGGDVHNAKQVLGAHPYEFLFAHFLARAKKSLEARPLAEFVMRDLKSFFFSMAEEMDDKDRKEFPGKEECARLLRCQATTYAALQERFLRSTFCLNYKKARVRGILGPDHSWIAGCAERDAKYAR